LEESNEPPNVNVDETFIIRKVTAKSLHDCMSEGI
jgi:hypothetical protein